MQVDDLLQYASAQQDLVISMVQGQVSELTQVLVLELALKLEEALLEEE